MGVRLIGGLLLSSIAVKDGPHFGVAPFGGVLLIKRPLFRRGHL